MQQRNRFIIVREDLLHDPLTIISEGLLIGRLSECELLLNHPTVSRVQAGLKQIDGEYYVFNLRPSNPIKLNGRAVAENQALAAGDVLQAGPFVMTVDLGADVLIVNVAVQIGRGLHYGDVSNPSLGTQKLEDLEVVLSGAKKKVPRAAPLAGTQALDIFWDKRIREAGKMVHPAPLFPNSQKRTGKAQFIWTPTADLINRWPVSYIVWGLIVVGILTTAGAFWYASAYAPAPLSNPHVADQLSIFPPIANKANNNSCISCHGFIRNMESRCASCHKAQGFVATVTQPHQAAGIGCVACHAEHKGAEFKPAQAALFTCTGCHNDSNKNIYNGKGVATPHGGTLGYPVSNGSWIWKGMDENEWATKGIAVSRSPDQTDEQWRSQQFHLLHLERVSAVGSLNADRAGRLSCSSCHQSFNPIDRETPKTTCALCHTGRIDPRTHRGLIAADKPDCISCHAQHVHAAQPSMPSGNLKKL